MAYSQGEDLEVSFQKDGAGSATSFECHSNDVTYTVDGVERDITSRCATQDQVRIVRLKEMFSGANKILLASGPFFAKADVGAEYTIIVSWNAGTGSTTLNNAILLGFETSSPSDGEMTQSYRFQVNG